MTPDGLLRQCLQETPAPDTEGALLTLIACLLGAPGPQGVIVQGPPGHRD